MLDHLQQTGSLPWVATDNAYPDQLAAFGQTWQRIIEESLRKGEISFEDYLTLALGVSPLLAQSARQNEGEFPPVPEAPATLQQGKLTLARPAGTAEGGAAEKRS